MKKYIEIIISIIAVFLTLYGVRMFNQYILMTLPLILRMILMIITYLTIGLVPFIFYIKNKIKVGLKKENLLKQIIIGIVIALLMNLFITIIPILLFGKENLYTGSNYKYLWQFIYYFIYCVFAVSLTEEFIFRGYILERLKTNKKIIPILISSILFGLFHIFTGNIAQIFITTFIGLILSISKEKIKNCTLLSLIIAHGIYDFLIEVITFVL